jgi:putative transposase
MSGDPEPPQPRRYHADLRVAAPAARLHRVLVGSAQPLVDSGAILVAALVIEANVQDRAAFPTLLRRAKRIIPTIAHVWVDNGYTSSTAADTAAEASVTVDVVSGPKPGRGFIVQPHQWVFEHTNGWINHCRRLDRHDETTLDADEGFLILSQIALPLRRLDHRQLFDTP